jgi:class 3 adenylate cyclase/tetratricopeptide (TPR) repeat protein
MECGHSLTVSSEPISKELSFDKKIERIQRYLPKGLTEKILAQKDKIEGERKQVTVMFCDMEGFTALVESLGPEEAYSIMDQVYEILIHKVHDYEGTVNEMTGDGVLALFGAPIALEDAPQRAIRSAFAIHREMATFSEKMKKERRGMPPLKMRMGIHTGQVVVGTLGNDLRVEFKAVGETVNLASRVEGLAEPGTTCVTHNTFKLTEGFFRFEALGEKRVKGKEAAVKVYRVIAPSTRRTRFDVSAERGLTPFVGRERELDLLLDAFERAKSGRGQAVSIMSEAGLGKSRLLYEFRKVVANLDATFLEGKCLSYSRGITYHPVIDILKSNFDVLETDKDSEIKRKIERGLEMVGADEAATMPYLLELLSIKDNSINEIPMTPEARKDRIIEALKQIVLKGSELRPLILAYEDLHWVDRNSEDVLRYLLESIPGARVLMIFTYRPQFVHTWGAKSYHNQITLNRLSNRESIIMMSHLLGTADVDRDLEELILEKTEGVPFFIEEFIRSITDLRIIERKGNRYHLSKDIQTFAIPSTIQDVIMARVDSLPEGAKDLLQTGSVIEREFSYDLIKCATALPDQELLSYLSVLKDSELLYERGIYPTSTYIFKHALTREVVYDSVLTARKKKLHEEIGNAAENLYKENIAKYYEVLAGHFICSEKYEKGAEYSRLAGKKAEKSASLNNAIFYVQKRIACLERLPATEEVQRQTIDARTALGLYISQLNHPVRAKEAIDPIIGLAISNNYRKRLSQIYTIIGVYNLYVEEEFSKAQKNLEEALRISDEMNDTLSSVLARLWLGVVFSLSCEFEKASYYLEKALDITTAANNLWGTTTLKGTLSYWVYNVQGKVNLGYQTSSDAIRMAEESGGTYSKATACLSHGTSCFYRGFLGEATRHLLKAVDSCEKIDLCIYHALDHNQLAETYFDAGKYENSIDHYAKAIRILENYRFSHSFINVNRVSQARAKVMNNDRDIDLESLYGYVTENGLKSYEGWLRANIAEILMNLNHQQMPKAEIWLRDAIKADDINGMRWHLGRDYALYAEWFRRKGDQMKFKENLNRAIDILNECGADGWVKKYEEELAFLT